MAKPFFFSRIDEIVEDLIAVIDFVQQNFQGKVYLIGHSMVGYTVTLFGSKFEKRVDGIITSGALTRYNLPLFGNPKRDRPSDVYIENELGEGVCSDETVIRKYKEDDLNAKQISMGLIYTLLDGVTYLKENARKFKYPILILHGMEDGLVIKIQ